jgi:hypothetical protein
MIAGIPAELIAEHVGAAMARTGSDVQAKFLNAFAKELMVCCGTEFAFEVQCHSISYGANEHLVHAAACWAMKEVK